MPFERYLAPPEPPYNPYNAAAAAAAADAAAADPLTDSPTFSTNVQFQLPHLMLAAPTLAPGGGAEVLPPAFLASNNPAASSWLSNSAYYASIDDLSSPAPLKHNHNHHLLPSSSAPQQPYLPAYQSHYPPYPPPNPPSPSPISPTSTISLSNFPPPTPLPLPPGLSVYSATGFDFLSILCRVASRPNPKIRLGPVDMSCAFVVADVRRYDSPIVYASPSFCKLTGYQEHEVIGRNCRFLQSPDGRLQRGDPRHFTAPEAASYLKRSLSAGKECQTSMINYRKGGAAFINLVTVIPLHGGVANSPDEADEIVYHVGFQVDLTQQPNAILQKLRDGSYAVDYSRKSALAQQHPQPMSTATTSSRDWRTSSVAMSGASIELRTLLADQAFVKSIPLYVHPAALSIPSPSSDRIDPFDGNKPLNLYLLECTPDFIHVMSLKGAFLYVAPSVRRVLGYSPEDLVGKSIAEFCHPADVVPLMRELKESSVATASSSSHPSNGLDGTDVQRAYSPLAYASGRPRSVDLLFRIRAQSGEYVWIECRGRLHVEPGKGRKAIILSGRVRHMPQLSWGLVDRAGGLATSPLAGAAAVDGRHPSSSSSEDEQADAECEFWSLLSASGAFLFVGAAVRDVLGWGAGEIIGRTIGNLIAGPASQDARRVVDAEIGRAFSARTEDSRHLSCEMQRKDGAVVVVRLVLYPAQGGGGKGAWPSPRQPLVCQVKLVDHRGARIVHPQDEGVFSELHIARGSSWQYELQQLKFANQRLLEEVAALEASVGQAQDQATPRISRQPYSQSELIYADESPPDLRYSMRPDVVQDWTSPYGQYQEQMSSSYSTMGTSGTKRTWTAYASGDA